VAHLIFYGKPGCAGNARQQALLRQAGHTLEVRDLLGWPWTAEALLAFLQPLPVAQWFNRAAPRVRSGEIDPDTIERELALSLLLAEPLLIRRPLLESDDHRCVGFDGAAIDAWVGLNPDAPRRNLEGCAAAQAPGGCVAQTAE
jgi:nitrogenase-associated protein